MKVSLQSFYSSFYGDEFARYFVRVPYKSNTKIYKQFPVQNTKQLWLNMDKVNGIYPTYASVYNYGSIDDLKRNDTKNIVLDRVFFDFDVSDSTINNLKKRLVELRTKNLKYNIHEQREIVNEMQELLIHNKVAEPAYKDCCLFSKLLENEFGKPALFFSGGKGCHAYPFFDPVKLSEPNKTIRHFSEVIKNKFNLKTMDLTVNNDPITRKSRIPYSKHHLTGLTVVPFEISATYEEVIEKAINPVVEPFHIEKYLTTLGRQLKEIDRILVNNSKIEAKVKKTNNSRVHRCHNKLGEDNRPYFKKILGEPTKTYEHYDMYNCPFPDHEDIKPSFMVHSKGYQCYGCDHEGDCMQFLKEYNGWDDKQVKQYLEDVQTT